MSQTDIGSSKDIFYINTAVSPNLFRIGLTQAGGGTLDANGYPNDLNFSFTFVRLVNPCTIGVVGDGLCFALGTEASNMLLQPNQIQAFEVTGVTIGVPYTVSITSSNTIGNMPVFEDNAFSSLLCLVVGPPGNCVATATGTSLFILVSDTSDIGGTFTLDVN